MGLKRAVGGLVVGLFLIGGVMVFGLSSTKINAGYIGIVYSLNGGVQDEILTQGLKFHKPWEKVREYSVATEQAYLSKDSKEGDGDDNSFSVPTSDGKTVNVDLEFSYYFDQDRLPEVYTKFKGKDGEDIEKTFIRGKMKAWTGEVSSKFSVLDIYGEKRSELNAEVLKHVQENFDDYGIVIESVNFSRIGLDEQTEQAIQKNINAQQALEQAKTEKQKAIIDAEKQVEVAEREAQAEVAKAKGQAEANDILAKSITDKVLKDKYINKWNGSLPQVQGESNPIIDLTK